MPLHPQARLAIGEWAGSGMAVGGASPEEIRAAGRTRALAAGEDVHRVEDRRVPGPDGDVPVRVYRPSAGAGLPLLVWYHGGGWVRGDIDQVDAVCRALANRAAAIVVSVGYRLAPEHRFPAAAEDCYAATRWVAEHADELGGDAARLAVGGSSAGGNLAAVVPLMARDRGGPALRHQLLVYPITDHDFERRSYRDNAEGYILTRASMIWFWDQYVPDEGERDHPYVSALKADRLGELPPAHVVTAEYDPLRDEGEAYADALRTAGVRVTCLRYDGQIHGFFGRLDSMDDARAALDEAAARLRRDLA